MALLVALQPWYGPALAMTLLAAIMAAHEWRLVRSVISAMAMTVAQWHIGPCWPLCHGCNSPLSGDG